MRIKKEDVFNKEQKALYILQNELFLSNVKWIEKEKIDALLLKDFDIGVIKRIKSKYQIKHHRIDSRKTVWLNPWYEGGDE